MRVGLALRNPVEHEAVDAWLREADMHPYALVDAAAVRSDVTGLYLDCLIVDDALVESGFLGAVRRHDPRLPVVLLSDPSAAEAAARRPRGTTVLERPLEPQALTLAVSLAHGEGRQARRRRRKPTGRFPARAGDATADILDVSEDGLRLELDRARAASLGPQFRLQVPMMALDVLVRRVWVARGRGDRVQCGALLVAPSATQRRAWQRVLDLAGTTAAVVADQPAPHRSAATAAAPSAGRLVALLNTPIGSLAGRLLGSA